MDKLQEHYVKQKSITKGYILCESSNMKLWRRQNHSVVGQWSPRELINQKGAQGNVQGKQ
jgi:hypothetical protein